MKRFLRVICFGTILGILILAVKLIFQPAEDEFWKIYLIISCLFIISAVVINSIYIRTCQKRMQSAVRLLENGRTKEYIETVEALYKKAKGHYPKCAFRLNLSTGYCELKEYDKAAAILEDLAKEKLKGDLEAVRRLNLCFCYFHTEQTKRAVELEMDSEALFERYRENPNYAGHFAVLDILTALANSRYEAAELMLGCARKKWKDNRLQSDYDDIEQMIKALKITGNVN